MPLQPQKTLTFNHDLNAATTSALNIRKNKDFETALPEYDSAIPRSTQQQCAAYAVAPTRNQTVFVRCVFELPGGNGFEVKATGGGVLGDLDPTAVGPSGAGTVTVDFPLAHRNFTAIGRHDVIWQWWMRPQGTQNWQALRKYLAPHLPGPHWTCRVAPLDSDIW